MGTNAAVNLANLYLAQFIDPFFLNHTKVHFYRRYIDDLLFFWEGSKDELDLFFREANNLLRKIKFTKEVSHDRLNCLDLTITKDPNGFIDYQPFAKPMSKFLYLTRNSCHPMSVFKGMIVGECLRYARHSSKPLTYLLNKLELIKHFKRRGYSKKFLFKYSEQVKWTSRFIEKRSQKRRISAFIVPFSQRPIYKQLNHTIKSEHFIWSTPILSYTVGKNIQNILCRSSLTPKQIEILSTRENFRGSRS
jgi:hypothetical protein